MPSLNEFQIFSSIYIDFDNIFTRIRDNYGGVTAHKFGNHISEWLDGLLMNISTKELYNIDGFKRVFSKKVVYLNPVIYGEYRISFVRHGFRVIDCPPLTLVNGKTSTDMNLAVEMLSDLYTKNYDEYFLLSADTDFSPVLSRINEMSKKTIVVAIGNISEHYRTIANYIIPEKEFVATFRKISSYSDTSNISDSDSNYQIPTQIKNTPPAKIIQKPEMENNKLLSLEQIKDLGFPLLTKEQYASIFSCILSALQKKKQVSKSVSFQLRKKYPDIQFETIKFFTSLIGHNLGKTKPLNMSALTSNILDNFFKSDMWITRKNFSLNTSDIIALLSNGKDIFDKNY